MASEEIVCAAVINVRQSIDTVNTIAARIRIERIKASPVRALPGIDLPSRYSRLDALRRARTLRCWRTFRHPNPNAGVCPSDLVPPRDRKSTQLNSTHH